MTSLVVPVIAFYFIFPTIEVNIDQHVCVFISEIGDKLVDFNRYYPVKFVFHLFVITWWNVIVIRKTVAFDVIPLKKNICTFTIPSYYLIHDISIFDALPGETRKPGIVSVFFFCCPPHGLPGSTELIDRQKPTLNPDSGRLQVHL